MTVRSTDDEFIIGPLTSDDDIYITEILRQKQAYADGSGDVPSSIVSVELPSGPFVYKFHLWSRLATFTANILLYCIVSHDTVICPQ